MTILTFRHIQCLHLMYAEVAWVLVSSGTQVQSQIILDPDYPPDYLSVSCDYATTQQTLGGFSLNFAPVYKIQLGIGKCTMLMLTQD